MRKISFIILVGLSQPVMAQKAEVIARMENYGISPETLGSGLKDHDATHYFEIDVTTNNGTENIVEHGEFNPERPVGSRWKLLDVNGNAPTKKQIKKFGKLHNTTKQQINGKVDDNSFKVVDDNAQELVISFKFDKNTLPNKFAFLADCTGKAYINKLSKRLEKAKFTNDKPLKVKIFNVQNLDMTVTYKYLEDDEMYVLQNEHLLMKVKLLGQLVDVEEINDYYSYKNVKY